jgi:hypothetical protein
LAALRQTLFDSIKTTPAFLSERIELRLLEEAHNNYRKTNNSGDRELPGRPEYFDLF